MSGERRPVEGWVVAHVGLETGLGIGPVEPGPWLAQRVAVARRAWRKGKARTCPHRRVPPAGETPTFFVAGRLVCAPCLPRSADEPVGVCEVCGRPESEHRSVAAVAAARLIAVVRHCSGCGPQVMRVLSREEVLAEGAGDA